MHISRKLISARRKTLSLLALFLFAASLFLGFTHTAMAGTVGANMFCIPSPSCPSPNDASVFFRYTTDKNTYAPGETITVSVHINSDDNPIGTGCYRIAVSTDGGATSQSFPACQDPSAFPAGVDFDISATAPAVAGPFNISFATSLNVYRGVPWRDIPLTVGVPLSVTANPVAAITLPNTAFTITYAVTNGNAATQCRLLNNVGVALTAYGPCTGSITHNTPAGPGVYGYFVQADKAGEIAQSGMVSVTVNPAVPIAGTCGPANGQTLAVAPAAPAQLCNTGTPSAVAGSGPWTWNCLGQNGGANSPQCSALLAVGATYSITASAGANGSIVPSGNVIVASGANQAFTITPSPGYVTTLTVDGVNVGAAPVWTFNNVVVNHTISASFALAVCPTYCCDFFVPGGDFDFQTCNFPVDVGPMCTLLGGVASGGNCPAAVPQPVLSITDPVAYGNVNVGDPAGVTRTISITNSGSVGTDVTLLFPPAPGANYSCTGGPTVNVPAGATRTRDCRLTTNLVGNIGGLATAIAVGHPTANKNFTITGTGVDGTNLSIFDVYNATPVSGTPHPINIGIVSTLFTRNYDFQIENAGSGLMDYTVVKQGGGSAGYSNSGTCGGTLNDSTTHTCRVTFSGGVGAGPQNATYRITNTTANPDVVYDIVFTSTVQSGPILQIIESPAQAQFSVALGGGRYDANFNNVNIGSNRMGRMSIINTGDLPLSFSWPALNSNGFTTAARALMSIPAGGSHNFTSTFAPTLPSGAKLADLLITTNDPAWPAGLTLRMLGTAVPVPSLSVTTQTGGSWGFGTGPGNLSFGDQEVTAGARSLWVRIQNTGSLASDVVIPALVAPFSRAPNSLNVSPGSTQEFTVSFDPAVANFYSTSLNLGATGYATPFVLNINGNGMNTPPGITPMSIDFGRTVVNKQKDLVVAITNTDTLGRDFGTVDLSLLDPQFTCINPAPCRIVLGPGASRNITLRFSPSSVGVKNTSLFFTGGQNGIDGFTIPVTGVGIRPLIQYKEN